MQASNSLRLTNFVARSVPKTQSTHEWDLELVSGLIFGATCTIFRAGAVPGAPGTPGGPGGPQIGQKPGAGFIM